MIQPMLYLKKMELNEMWEVGPSTMIQPNSGCTLAIMAITKLLQDWIWHVYWLFSFSF